MVVGVDVVGDLFPCLVEGFPLGAPGAALLELAEPGLDERLALRIPMLKLGDAALAYPGLVGSEG